MGKGKPKRNWANPWNMEDARRAVLGFQMSKLRKHVASKGKRKIAGSRQMETAHEQPNIVKLLHCSTEMPRKPCSSCLQSCSSRLWTSESLLSTDERPASCFTSGVSLLYDKQQSTLSLPQEKNSETRRMSMIESELLPLGSVLLKRKQHVRFDSIVYVTTTEEIWNLRTSESFKNVYRNIICNDQNIETTQMPFDWGANETFPDDGICSAVKN